MGDGTRDIQTISVENFSNFIARVHVSGPGGVPLQANILRIDTLAPVPPTGRGPVQLEELFLAGDLGVASAGTAALRVDRIVDAQIGGSVLNDIEVSGITGGNLGLVAIAGDCLGDVFVLNGNLVELEVGGDVGGPSEPVVISVPNGSITSIEAGAAYANISTGIGNGSVLQRLVTAGSFTGSVSVNSVALADAGHPRQIEIGGAFTGSFAVARGTETEIHIEGDLNGPLVVNLGIAKPITIGSITMPADVTPGGSIAVGAAIGDGDVHVTGDLAGSITVAGTPSSPADLETGRTISIGGSVLSSGEITILGDVGETDPARPPSDGFIDIAGRMDGAIAVGGSLTAGSAVEIGADAGLGGQIIVNASDCALAGCDWDGDVVVGTTSPITLSQDYATLPAQLGGGAVGLVPFNMHGLACTPPYNGGAPPVRLISDFAHTSPNSEDHFDILIEHYGPIEGGADPIEVDMWNAATDDWEIMGSLHMILTVEMAQDINNRTIRITPKSDKTKGLYRFRPSSTLVCADVFSTSVPVHKWEYQIDLRPDCDSDGIEDPPFGPDTDISACGSGPQCCDIDDEPGVDVFDLLFYLDCWFPEAACAEWTNDDPPSIDVFDLLAYLDCWFSTDPCQ